MAACPVCAQNEAKTRIREWSSLPRLPGSLELVLDIVVGRICTQHITLVIHWSDSIPVLFWVPHSLLSSGGTRGQVQVQWCRQMWSRVRLTVLKLLTAYKQAVGKKRQEAPECCPGLKLWLYTKDLSLQFESSELTSRFIVCSGCQKLFYLPYPCSVTYLK